MSRKKIEQAYRKGLEDGARPFGEKLQRESESAEQIKRELNDYKEEQDILNEAANPRYKEIREQLSRESRTRKNAILQFCQYDISECISVFQKLIDNDDYSSCFYLGEIYYYGYGDISVDYEKSHEYFSVGYVHDDILCTLKMAEYFPTTLPHSVTPISIYSDFIDKTKGSAGKSIPSEILNYEIGRIYEYGFGVDVDITKAYTCYMESVKGDGYFKTFYKLYQCLLNGYGTEIDANKSQHYLNKCKSLKYDGR